MKVFKLLVYFRARVAWLVAGEFMCAVSAVSRRGGRIAMDDPRPRP